jgi:carboxypeptidase family protein
MPFPNARRLVLLLLLSLGLAAASSARAQGSAVLRGVVYDSLITFAPLEGAEIWIESTNRMAKSDVAGRFALSELVPGRYVLTFYHPILDSAGLSVPPVVVEVVAGDSNNVALATPSPTEAHHMLCPRDPLRQMGSVLGIVHNASDENPIRGATISANWTSYDIGQGSVRRTQRSVEAKTDASGHVLLCGLPTDVALVIRGRGVAGATGMAVIDLHGRLFARADLHLGGSERTGVVSGIVRNRRGSLMPGVRVSAIGTEASVQSDDYGRFSLPGVAAGSGIVEARAVGYMPGRAQVNVRPDGDQQVDIVIGDSVTVLDPVTVTAEYQPYLSRVGFLQRRQNAAGHFLDTADVRKSGATQFEEVFRLVPGATLRPNGSGMLVELARGQGQILNPALANYCPPAYFIDGVFYPLPPIQTPTVPIIPSEILAIEVYSDMISAPPQYQRRDAACGIILVWTKRGVPKHRSTP